MKETSNSIELAIHSRNRYRLAHLLGKGRVLRQGGRVSAKPHIGPAKGEGVRGLEENIMRRSQDAPS